MEDEDDENGINGDDIGALVKGGIKTMQRVSFAAREELARAVNGRIGDERLDAIVERTATAWLRAEYATGESGLALQRLPELVLPGPERSA